MIVLLRVFEAFSGYGSQSLALERLGIEHKVVGISEIDENAIKAYYALHSKNIKNFGDISQINPADLPKFDLFTYSFPCFVGDTLILTDKGYKEIKDIVVGDNVLTHNNQYKPVLKSMMTGKKEIYKIKGMAFDELNCTENHKFYIRERYRKYARKEDGKPTQIRLFTEPKWVECKELTKDMFLGVAINQKEILPNWSGITFHWHDGRKDRHKNQISPLLNKYDFWWIVGRYLGDGWFRHSNGIIICGPKEEIPEIEEKLNKCGFNYSIAKERTVDKIHIPLKELELFLQPFGKGASNKCVPGFVFDLPVEQLKGFVDGYISADGYINKNNFYIASSVSRELIYGIAQCIAKVYKKPYSIYHNVRKNYCIIEGRKCNQKESWQVKFKKDFRKQDKSFYENGYIWFPINSIENTFQIQNVYDIEVANDHSFTANGSIVHNCTDISLTGKLEGLERGKTRSGLLYECEKIIEYCRPKYLLMENVKSLVGSRFKCKFDEWLKYLESLGYKNQWFILNARDFDVPQNRERVFCVSILGEQPCLMFPKLCCVHSLFDYLEHSVDEKYIKEFRKDLVDVFSNGAYRGRYDENGKIFQKLELRSDCVSNTITSVPKDNVVVINGVVRYLTERECGRLMGLTDNEIFKIFESGISKSKLYKLFGNSIVIPCLMGIFDSLFNQ